MLVDVDVEYDVDRSPLGPVVIYGITSTVMVSSSYGNERVVDSAPR